jgi:MtN3 and saliva related transmembrane protein
LTIVSLLGAIAALCSVVSFTPQALKIIRTGETKDLSVVMYVLTVSGFGCWAAYGILLGQWPLVASNTLCFLLSAFILAMMLLPRSKRKGVAETLKSKEP